MSNMCMAKIKACLLMSAQSRFFSNTSPVHPSSLQPLSCSFIHPPSHVPISSNIHVRHVTEVHAAGEGQLHHSSLLVGCQGGIKPTANVCWKSERFGGKHSTSWSWDICHDIHRTFVTLNIYIYVIIKGIRFWGMNMAQPMQQLLLEEKNCTTWDVANPVLSH